MDPATAVGFATALRALQQERFRETPVHCTLQELAAYHRGSLSSERRAEVVEHLTVCENCVILLLYGVISLDDPEQRGDQHDIEAEAAWVRLRPRFRGAFLRGRPLSALLKDRALSLEEVLSIGLEASQALAEVHATGRVVDDLRAESILISATGPPHVLELSRTTALESFEADSAGPAEAAVVNLCRAISPEQMAGEGLDQRSNLFSLGVLLYEMATGVSPFRDSSPLATASRILALEPPPASELNLGVVPALSRLIERLLAKDPEDRPPSVAAMALELASILADLSGPNSSSTKFETLQPEAQIERLYTEIIALSQEEDREGSRTRSKEIEQAYERLRELQGAAAASFLEQFEASLHMPVDAGDRILADARRLRRELEDLASSDSAAPNADDAEASAGSR